MALSTRPPRSSAARYPLKAEPDQLHRPDQLPAACAGWAQRLTPSGHAATSSAPRDTTEARDSPATNLQRVFVLSVVQPGLAVLMGGLMATSISSTTLP